MSRNRGVVYTKPGEVQVQNIADPKFEDPHGRKIEHAVILKVVSTNICGSDQHMVRGRTTAQAGLVLGHEITGEVIETGADVELLRKGDVVSVPFNVACGRCRTCKSGDTGVCLHVNDARAGGAYGYVDMGGWIGGQARYVMVPYADFNLLKFPDKDKALSKIMDLTMLTDILPTGFHGALNAGVKPGSTVYVAGAGPVGLAAAASAQLLGAAIIMIGDMNEARRRRVVPAFRLYPHRYRAGAELDARRPRARWPPGVRWPAPADGRQICRWEKSDDARRRCMAASDGDRAAWAAAPARPRGIHSPHQKPALQPVIATPISLPTP